MKSPFIENQHNSNELYYGMNLSINLTVIMSKWKKKTLNTYIVKYALNKSSNEKQMLLKCIGIWKFYDDPHILLRKNRNWIINRYPIEKIRQTAWGRERWSRWQTILPN